MNIQDWFPLGWSGWISLQSQGLSRVFSNTTIQKHQFFSAQPSLWFTSHIHTWLLETIALTIWTFVSKVMSLLFDMLSRFVIAFLSRRKYFLISWLQSLSTVILELKEMVARIHDLATQQQHESDVVLGTIHRHFKMIVHTVKWNISCHINK